MSTTSSTMESKPSSSPFRFLELPAEIRNQVYAHYTVPTTVIQHAASEAEQNLSHFKETEEKQYQFLGLALASRQLRSEFLPLYLSENEITVKLSDLNPFLQTFYPNADASTRGTLIVDLDGLKSTPVDILLLFRLIKMAPGFTFDFVSDTCPTEALRDTLRSVREEVASWNALLNKKGAGAYLARYGPRTLYIKKKLDGNSYFDDLDTDGIYWVMNNGIPLFYGTDDDDDVEVEA